MDCSALTHPVGNPVDNQFWRSILNHQVINSEGEVQNSQCGSIIGVLHRLQQLPGWPVLDPDSLLLRHDGHAKPLIVNVQFLSGWRLEIEAVQIGCNLAPHHHSANPNTCALALASSKRNELVSFLIGLDITKESIVDAIWTSHGKCLLLLQKALWAPFFRLLPHVGVHMHGSEIDKHLSAPWNLVAHHFSLIQGHMRKTKGSEVLPAHQLQNDCVQVRQIWPVLESW